MCYGMFGEAVGARSGLDGYGESGCGTGMARFGLAVEVWCDAFGWGTVGSGVAVKLRSVEIGQVRFGLSSYGGLGGHGGVCWGSMG